ncbi:MAG: flagellar export chaperone FliS [Desulfovibrio sp.]|uniref:flagellar export chaperone FliS n=1 Tax=Desulfovibrio sp. TaxID=885 RepID=UPI0039E4C0CD
MNKAANAYFQTKVGTTDQGQLLLMLYDGALKYIQQARTKMLAKDFAGKGIMISKVIDIVNELAASLNMDKGGSLAVNLNNLYLLCTARLLRANLKMDVESLDSVETILSGLRGAYAQIIETPEARKVAADIATRMQPTGSVTKTAQPIMQHQGTAVPRAHAQAAYGRNSMMPPQAMDASATATVAAAAPQPNLPGYSPAPAPVPSQTPMPAVPVAPSASLATGAAPAQTAPRAHVQAFDQAMSQPPAAPKGFAPNRLPGAYGKVPPRG